MQSTPLVNYSLSLSLSRSQSMAYIRIRILVFLMKCSMQKATANKCQTETDQNCWDGKSNQFDFYVTVETQVCYLIFRWIRCSFLVFDVVTLLLLFTYLAAFLSVFSLSLSFYLSLTLSFSVCLGWVAVLWWGSYEWICFCQF